MVIAIEGMDGVGKSSVASGVSKKLGIKHSGKIMAEIMDVDDEHFRKLVKYVRGSDNKKLAFVFYTLKSMLDNQSAEDLIVERTMMSVYYFESKNVTDEDFDYAMGLGVIPDLTFLLYASSDVREARIRKRNPYDSDLNDKEALCDGYDCYYVFAEKYNMPYIEIDTERYSCNEVVDLCSNMILNYRSLPLCLRDGFLDNMNSIYGRRNNADGKKVCKKKSKI